MNSQIRKFVTLTLAVSTVSLATPVFAQGRGGGGGGRGAGMGGGASASHGNPFGDSSPGIGARGTMRDPMDVPGRPDRPESPDRPLRPADAPRPGAGKSAAAQDFAGTMKSINESSFEQRRDIVRNLDMSLETSRAQLRKVQSDAKALRGEARDQFKAALAETKAREKELRTSMKAAQNASPTAWDKAHDDLAAAYQRYNDALRRAADRAKVPTPPSPPAP